MTSIQYPSYPVNGYYAGWNGPTYTYGFDTLARPVSLTDGGSATCLSGVQYNAAGQMLDQYCQCRCNNPQSAG
jgi:hypothetical protein